MDTSAVFTGPEETEIEGYKIYMYKAFANDIVRFMSKRLIASIKYEIHPETDSIDIYIRHNMKKDGYVVIGTAGMDAVVHNVLASIKDEQAWPIAMKICDDYKNEVWHCFFKERKKRQEELPDPDINDVVDTTREELEAANE